MKTETKIGLCSIGMLVTGTGTIVGCAIIILMLLLGCGPAPSKKVEGMEFGTLEEPIFMPNFYGGELGGGQLECSPPWDGNGCAVPDSKGFKLKFFADTCDPWFQERYMEVINEMAGLIWSLGDDWGLFWSDNYKYRLDCGTTSGFASFSFKTGDTDKHSTPYGTLYQHKKGTVRLDITDIINHVNWATATDEERRFFARNVLRQEFLHMFGHGHHSSQGGPNVMDGPDESWWHEDKYLTPEMEERMRCYNEDSGASDDC